MRTPEHSGFEVNIERARIIAQAQIDYGSRLIESGEELLGLLGLLERLEHKGAQQPTDK